MGSDLVIRVLQVVTYMGRGGLETVLMNYYRHIDRTQVQFDFLVHRNFEADYDAEIRRMGGRIYPVSRLIPWSLRYRRELKCFFQSHPEYRIIHVHQDCLSAVALQCAQQCGIPVRIAHSHTSKQDRNFRYLIKLYYRRKIPEFATDLYACGSSAGEWMFGAHPFRVLPNAIDLSAYRWSPERSCKVRRQWQLSGSIVIGHVGRFDALKNHSFLLDVFAAFLNRIPDAKLLLIGDGPERAKMEEKAASLHIRDKVIFTGTRGDVPDLMQAMDLFLFPSLYEGTPVVMIEAQASGLPCVKSDGVPEDCIVTSGLVTTMHLSDSPQTWAEHLVERIKTLRGDHSAEIRAAGYDIELEARKLQNEYLRKYWEAVRGREEKAGCP